MTSDEWLNFFEHPDVFAFCAKIAENPDDLAPKLVFADWLEENCSDEWFAGIYRKAISDKSIFPRAMIIPDDVDEYNLFAKDKSWHGVVCLPAAGQFEITNWRGIEPLQRLVNSGMVFSVHISSGFLNELAFPETLYKLNYWLGERDFLRQDLDFSHIRELEYSGSSPEGSFGNEVLDSSSLTNLQSLRITGRVCDDDFLFRLSDTPTIANVNRLTISNTLQSGTGLIAIAQSPFVRNIQQLDLDQSRLHRIAVKAILESPYLSKMTELHLANVIIEDDNEFQKYWEELVTNKGSNRLKAFSVGMAYRDYLSIFFQTRNFLNLEVLVMEYSNLENDVLQCFLDSSSFPSLKEIYFFGNSLDDEGAVAIAKSPRMKKIEFINLEANLITEVGRRALLESPFLTDSAKLGIEKSRVGQT